MFQVGDKIVHPMHGAGIIESIVSQKIDGTSREYFVMRIPAGGMLVMIPTLNCDEIGVRAVCDSSTAKELIESIPDMKIDMTHNWNRRYRENMLRIKSGDLTEVAKVVKGLTARERERGLSTGERKMLHNAKQILISELVLAQSSNYDEVERRINSQM